MPKIVISDTSTLIVFQKIEELNLLHKVYGQLITTPEIAQKYGDSLPHWIKIESVKDKKYQKFVETLVDLGEASAIALARCFVASRRSKSQKTCNKIGFKGHWCISCYK